MLVRHLLRTAASTFSLLVMAAAPALAESPPKVQAEDRLSRVLDAWQQRSATRTSLDVRFERTERDDIWHEKHLSTGRVLLSPNGQCLVEYVKTDECHKSAAVKRIIWTNEAMHQIWPEQKVQMIWPISVKDRGRLPAPLALPFLWHVGAEELKSRYRVELMKEDTESWLLSFTPRKTAGQQWFAHAYLWLDRVTYLPRRYLVIAPVGKCSNDYRVTETRCDQPVPEEAMQLPEGDDWHVTRIDETPVLRWFSQLIKFELIP